MVLLIIQLKVSCLGLFIYFGDTFTVCSIYAYSMTAKVVVINDKWAQNSQTTVISSLANFCTITILIR